MGVILFALKVAGVSLAILALALAVLLVLIPITWIFIRCIAKFDDWAEDRFGGDRDGHDHYDPD